MSFTTTMQKISTKVQDATGLRLKQKPMHEKLAEQAVDFGRKYKLDHPIVLACLMWSSCLVPWFNTQLVGGVSPCALSLLILSQLVQMAPAWSAAITGPLHLMITSVATVLGSLGLLSPMDLIRGVVGVSAFGTKAVPIVLCQIIYVLVAFVVTCHAAKYANVSFASALPPMPSYKIASTTAAAATVITCTTLLISGLTLPSYGLVFAMCVAAFMSICAPQLDAAQQQKSA